MAFRRFRAIGIGRFCKDYVYTIYRYVTRYYMTDGYVETRHN